MDTALPQKFPFILDRNLAKANCTGNRVCMSCDTVVLGPYSLVLEPWRGEHSPSAAGTLQHKRNAAPVLVRKPNANLQSSARQDLSIDVSITNLG